MNKYEEAINLITSREKFHICLGLERISEILRLLGNPQEKLKIIQVAGTNGKGSVCAILSKILACAGYKTGLYTSPHIIDYTERIRINNCPVSKQDFADLIFEISQIALENEIYLTEFEILTAAGYKYFYDKEVDICVVETGLGGRFDATNAVSSNIASIITSISLDHTDRLGNSVEEIAFEKSGIIKSGCPVVVSPQNKGFSVISKAASEKNSPVVEAVQGVELSYENEQNAAQSHTHKFIQNGVHNAVQDFIQNYAIYRGKKYKFNLLGLWQKENLELVLACVEYLNKNGFEISENSIEKALSKVVWDCRMQFVPKYKILIDGTHNPDGARVLRESLDYYFPNEKRIWVYGSLTTKDYEKVMKTLFREEDEVYFYDFNYPKSAKTQDLRAIIPQGMPINQTELEYLCAENRKNLVIISGSFYMIGSILASKDFYFLRQNIAELDNI